MTMDCMVEGLKTLYTQVQRFQATLEGTIFRPKHTTSEFNFITGFVKVANNLDIPEAHASLILSKLLINRAESYLRSILFEA